jgi:hypothetical protein
MSAITADPTNAPSFPWMSDNNAPRLTQPLARGSTQKMKKWKCLVCGYIHTGDEPPEKCPVCGAPKSQFIDVTEPEAPAPEPAPPAATETQPATDSPVISEPAAAAKPAEPEPVSPFKDSRYRQLFEMMTQYHGHPISVHIPNGLLPVTILFIFLSALFSIKGMTTAATYNLGAVALSMPLVLFFGWVDWQNRFNGAITECFYREDRLRHHRHGHRLVSVYLAAGQPGGGHHPPTLPGCLFHDQPYYAGCGQHRRMVRRKAGI